MTRIKRQRRSGYKLIYNDEGLFSAFCEGIRIKYTPGKKTFKTLPNGPLAVFDTLENVRAFNEDHAGHEIWACSYRESIHSKLWYRWHTANSNIEQGFAPPRGTRFADNVTLLERVKKEGDKT